MKETIEVIKCDLCGKIIDTNSVPKSKCHYARVYYDSTKDESVLKECDVCMACQQMISNHYNSDHGKDIKDLINETIKRLTRNECRYFEDNMHKICISVPKMRDILEEVFLHEDEEDN